MIKCFDDSQAIIIPDIDTPVCELEMTEPPTPTSTFFTLNAKTPNEKKYMVIKCYPYVDKNGDEAWAATIKQVQTMGAGQMPRIS